MMMNFLTSRGSHLGHAIPEELLVNWKNITTISRILQLVLRIILDLIYSPAPDLIGETCGGTSIYAVTFFSNFLLTLACTHLLPAGSS